jgi:hypothetical protein
LSALVNVQYSLIQNTQAQQLRKRYPVTYYMKRTYDQTLAKGNQVTKFRLQSQTIRTSLLLQLIEIAD